MASLHTNRVLLTGASGFIGRRCLAPLLERGYEVHAVSSRPVDQAHSAITWHRADLLDPKSARQLLAAVQPAYLLHLAWYVEPGKLISAEENVAWVSASLNLVTAFRDSGGARCVISGSCYEYDWRFGYCSEDITPCRPDTLYGGAKHGLYTTFKTFCESHGIYGAWARPFFMYGPGEDERRLVSSTAIALLSGKEARSSHGRQIRDYMHVQDVADALVALLAVPDAKGAFNVASGRASTIREIVETVGQITGRSDLLRIGAIETRANDAPLVVGDPTRLHAATGWTPKFDLASGLEDTVTWWRAQLTKRSTKS